MQQDVLWNRLLTSLPSRTGVPLRLTLWNGTEHEFGDHPKVTVRLRSPTALRHFLPPSLDNLAEGYVSEQLDVNGTVKDVVETALRLAHAAVPIAGRFGRLFKTSLHNREKDAAAIHYHYDRSNDFYRLWLDPGLIYSCAYFPANELSLEQAQLEKIDHILHKLMLKPGQSLLDVGCGWGSLAIHAARKYGAQVVGITLSKNQHALATERVALAGVQDKVEIRIQDYRDVAEKFDRISSVGMFEHVGLRHLGAYFSKLKTHLNDGGLVMNHGITSTDINSGGAPPGAGGFISKYVFPQGELPHLSLAMREMEGAGLEVLDVENLRRHYARTLALWAENYEKNSAAIRATVDEATFRVWRVYLAGCALAFEKNWVSLYQVLACKSGERAALNPTPWSRKYMYS